MTHRLDEGISLMCNGHLRRRPREREEYVNTLKRELENIVMETIAEWESNNSFIVHHSFSIRALELITGDIKTEINEYA